MKLGLNMTEVKPEGNGADDLLPSGEYNIQIIGCDLIDTKSGHALKIIMKIIDGEQENKQCSDFINFKNASETAQRIALSRLRKITELTIGKAVLADSDELLNKKLKIRTEQEQRGEYFYNKIKSYSPADKAGSSIAAASNDAAKEFKQSKKNPWD
jgi:hypothetical protein